MSFKDWTPEMVEAFNAKNVKSGAVKTWQEICGAILDDANVLDVRSMYISEPTKPSDRMQLLADKFVPVGFSRSLCFTVAVDPMGAPRMTRADVWKKRPVVLRYRAYADALRNAFSAAVKGDLPPPPDRLDIVCHVAVSDSWSEKKKQAMAGQPHRQRFDSDNALKAAADSLFLEDSGIWSMSVQKYWCREGQQRIEISMFWK